MRPFHLTTAATTSDAISAAAGGGKFLAGGTTLVDLMKLDVMQPVELVDINGLDTDAKLGAIELVDGEVRLGSLVRMSDVIEHDELAREMPLLAQSLSLAASQQLRNMASLGGNVMQRTRCPYFRDVSWTACNKREAGSGCAARTGFNRMHAVLGGNDECVATYPGDLAQSLMALDAKVDLEGPGGMRSIPFGELHRPVGSSPDIETTLKQGELITSFRIARAPWLRRSLYVKIRDRASYEFALASAAVALNLEGDVVREARIALGGVATRPWRAREAEAALKGQPLRVETAGAAAESAFADARPLKFNAFKIPLGKATLVRALLAAKAMGV